MKFYHYLFLLIITVSLSSCTFDCDSTEVTEPERTLTPASPYYPGDGSLGISRSPVFIWDGHLEDDYDGSYRFTINVSPLYSGGDWRIPAGSDTILQFPDTLDAETFYSWSVTTEGSGGRSEKSRSHYFTTGVGFNNEPTRPILMYPPDNSLEVPVDITFAWYCLDPDGDPLSFDLWYCPEGDTDSTHVSSLATAEHSASLDADTDYIWWITAFDDRGGSSTSGPGSFSTVSTPPPHDPFPSDGAENVPLDLTMSWSCADPDGDALAYDVEMGLVGSGMSVIGAGILQAELPVTGLMEGRTYQWKITAEDDDGHRKEGPVWTFATVGAPGDVFADLTLTRKQTKSGIETIIIDNMWARFDESYAPQYALRPLQPPAVSCGGIDLEWVAGNYRYYYENAHTLTFLNPGASYTFSVAEGGGVSALTESILFPQCAPVITSPSTFDPVSLGGFEVTWSGFDAFPDCARQVSLAILDIMGDSTGVYVTTENDGSYTFTAGELSVIDPALIDLQIVLVVQNLGSIDEPGYDPRSWIRARTLSVVTVYKE